MTACGLMPFPLVSDPFNEPFAQCWEKLTDLVRGAPVLKKCQNCELRELCNPCAATVFAECGDVNGTAEYLCQTAQCIEKEITTYLEERKNEA